MKLPSISLMAGGLMLIATSAMAADTMTTGPSGFTSPQGLPPSTPEQSTGRPLGSLPELSPTMPEGATQTMPNSAGTSSEEPTSPGAAAPPSAGGG
jgi:hypothetical protein